MTWLRSQFRTFVWIVRFWRENLTIEGKTVTVILLACLLALTALDSPLFLFFLTQFSLLVVTCAASHWCRPRLKIRVRPPGDVVCGESVPLQIWISNSAAQPACDLTLRWSHLPLGWESVHEASTIRQLDGRATAAVALTVRPTRRGRFELPDLIVSGSFPLKLFRLANRHSLHGELLVLPKYQPLQAIEFASSALSLAGDQHAGVIQAGSGGDYFGSREYLPGMPVRRWDYSSWARLGQPVVREFTVPQRGVAAIAIDNSITADGRDESVLLESTLQLAAGISEAVTNAGYRLSRLLTSDIDHSFTESEAAEQHLACWRRLAVLAPADEGGAARLRGCLTRRPPRQTLVYLLLQRWSPAWESLCNELSQTGCEVKAILVADKPGSTPSSAALVVTPDDIAAGEVVIS